MSFWDDVSDFGSSLFTGRWTGGENSVGDVWNRDPWAVVAPVAALAGGAALGAGALGAGPAAGLFGGAEAAGAAGGGALGFAGEAGAEGTGALSSFLANPEGGALGYGPVSTAFDPEIAGAATPGWLETAQANPATGSLWGDLGVGGAGSGVSGGGSAIGGGAGGAAGGAGAGSGGFWSDLTRGAVNSVTRNPLGIAAGAAGLGMMALRGNQQDPNRERLGQIAPGLQGQAAGMTAQGQELQSYLTSGTLPPALQTRVDEAVRAEKAQIISGYASRGMPTDPNANSSLAADLAQAERNGVVLAGQLQQNLATQGQTMINAGLNATGLSANLYSTLSRMDREDNQDLMRAIANMSAAFGGSSRPASTNQRAA